MTNSLEIAAVDEAITSRRSCRRFLQTPVPKEWIVDILQVASRAPSGHNSQPWHVHVLTDKALSDFTTHLLSEYDDPARNRFHTENNDVYTTEWRSPFIERRRKTGRALYESLKIARGDQARMHEQMRKNYHFFGAPVGMIFTLDNAMSRSRLDYGMFMQNIITAARARGLDTCAQAAFAIFYRAVQEALELPDNAKVICGLALGFADESAPENRFWTEREPVSEFATFYNELPSSHLRSETRAADRDLATPR